MKKRKMQAFDIFNHITLLILGLSCVLPFISVLSVSVSDKAAVAAGGIAILPVGFTLDNYAYALSQKQFLFSMLNSVFRVVLAVGLSLIVSTLAAYPLSKKKSIFPGRSYFAWFFVITMLIGAGMVPRFMIVDATQLRNTIWALVLPSAANAFFITILLNFFRGIPEELEEAAFLDGAGHWSILLKIYVPLAVPAFVTLIIYCVVAHWNEWFEGYIYLDQVKLYPLSTYLRGVVTVPNFGTLGIRTAMEKMNINSRSFTAAQILIGSLPILIIYPFLQKYFIKGMTLGSVKG
jgi:putative aldouronate transport system permease protein